MRSEIQLALSLILSVDCCTNWFFHWICYNLICSNISFGHNHCYQRTYNWYSPNTTARTIIQPFVLSVFLVHNSAKRLWNIYWSCGTTILWGGQKMEFHSCYRGHQVSAYYSSMLIIIIYFQRLVDINKFMCSITLEH